MNVCSMNEIIAELSHFYRKVDIICKILMVLNTIFSLMVK